MRGVRVFARVARRGRGAAERVERFGVQLDHPGTKEWFFFQSVQSRRQSTTPAITASKCVVADKGGQTEKKNSVKPGNQHKRKWLISLMAADTMAPPGNDSFQTMKRK